MNKIEEKDNRKGSKDLVVVVAVAVCLAWERWLTRGVGIMAMTLIYLGKRTPTPHEASIPHILRLNTTTLDENWVTYLALF